MEILDGTIISTAAAGMAGDLNVQAVDINLAITSTLTTVAVGIPISGWLAERFGVRRVFTLASAIFTIVSLLCALGPNLMFLCGARMRQGMGVIMLYPVVEARRMHHTAGDWLRTR